MILVLQDLNEFYRISLFRPDINTALHHVVEIDGGIFALHEQIVAQQMKLAMSVGKNRHCAIEYIGARHFVQTSERRSLPEIFPVNPKKLFLIIYYSPHFWHDSQR